MSVSSNKRLLVWLKTKGRCSYCGIDLLVAAEGKNTFCIDHLVPLSVGGRNNIENLAPSCRSCNSVKGTKTLEEFRFYKWQKQIEKEYGARFTQKQEEALKKMGFEFSMPLYVFWFEKQDIKIQEM
jgi:5-methylcytosine-specific restriction endonuclease McrA